MPETSPDLKDLTRAITTAIGSLSQPVLNGFAGTGKSRKREKSTLHPITRHIMERGLLSYAFSCGGERVPRRDAYMTVLTVLFDIDDDDARLWTDKSEWDAARHEAAREIARTLLRKFTVEPRQRIEIPVPADKATWGGSHNHSRWYYEED